VLFVLALLAALSGGRYFALKFIEVLFSKMDSQVAAVTVIASVVALLAAKIIQTLSHMTRTEQPLFPDCSTVSWNWDGFDSLLGRPFS